MPPIEVIVVEDSQTQLLILRHTLERHGHVVRTARNGREAFEALAKRPPGLVITDIVMPEMDGYELCRRIKDDPKLKELPVILVTSLSDAKDILRGLECGADNFIVKPYSEEFLLSRIQYVMENVALRRGTSGKQPVEIFYGGQKYNLTTERIHSIDLLLSAYETAVQKNLELSKAKAQLEEQASQLREALVRADAANEAKGAFLAAMSHEIRTPMNAILGFAELMRQDKSLAAPHIGQVEIINRAGEHLLALINDVLDISKIEAGRIKRNDSAFDLHLVLDGLVELHARPARAKGITISSERAPDLPRHIVCDEGKLCQILGNIVGNAVKFTKDGEIRMVANRAQIVGDEVELRFAITDTGPGITPEELSKLFRPFVQGVAGISAGGTGLGLSIAREYAKFLGGDITVTSAVGRGSTFTVAIHARMAESADIVDRLEKPAILRLSEGSPATRILVVDDDPTNRQLLTDMLGPIGFEVRVAEDGRRAVEAFAQWQPHAILMDMRMPQMDGIEATRQIRAMPHGADTLIVALSASAFEEERIAFTESGADIFMSKPFRHGELLDYLGEHLDLRYVYDDAAVAPAPSVQVNPGALASIAPPVRAAFIAACRQADCEKLMELCDALTDVDPETVNALRESIARYDYESLAVLLSESETPLE